MYATFLHCHGLLEESPTAYQMEITFTRATEICCKRCRWLWHRSRCTRMNFASIAQQQKDSVLCRAPLPVNAAQPLPVRQWNWQ